MERSRVANPEICEATPKLALDPPQRHAAPMFRFHLQILVGAALLPLLADAKPRARELGIPFDGTPGPLNAITDVAGVEVGHVTLISGEGKLEVGRGPVRTGVTAILPR